MVRLSSCLLGINLAACQLGVSASKYLQFWMHLDLKTDLSLRSIQLGPIVHRASNGGNLLQCNIGRLRTVTGLASTTSAVQKISSVAELRRRCDCVVSQSPPVDARAQVGKGLNAAQTALASITTSNAAVTSGITNAQAKLKQTIAAGQEVVDSCGGLQIQVHQVSPVTASATPSFEPVKCTTDIFRRTLVEDGLKAAQDALSAFAMMDPAVVAVQDQITETQTAGGAIVSNCK
ncbi:hypothetical protein Hypma_008497 [Hypsizygus marmoreus]|uniref:Uncharacterized protein n=1 Tax=Hypsizygus marmoreus TaxID=39966 RepID=A0A369JV48_HYPMA|nr:hypothetical protein Hypma_008497 [Hypsizygus marmoreus]